MSRMRAASAPARRRLLSSTRCATALWVAAMLSIGWSAPVDAQDQAKPSTVTVVGQVIDSESGQPLPGAVVEIDELNRRAVSDQDGRFRLERIKPGVYAIEIRQLGYAPLVDSWTLEAGVHNVAAGLHPRPIVLEGIRVQTDRFARRRNAVPTSVRIFDRSELLTTGASTADEFVLQRGAISRTTCPQRSRAISFANECVWVRGRPVAPAVYIDEMPAIGGLLQLSHYRPHELYMVEVYGQGRHIRAYTQWYIERVAKSGQTPMPLLFF